MAVVTIPGSKSVTARALLLAAAAAGRTTLVDPLLSDDTEAFVDGLRALGYQVVADGREWTIDGRAAGPGASRAEVFCRDGATTARFLPALAAAGRGTFAFDASDQMRARPMAPLTRALRSLGAGLTFQGEPEHHPFVVEARGIEGGTIRLDAGTSSQFLTALLLVAPLSRDGLTIEVTDLVSVPYVGITLAMMRDFGVDVEVDGGTYTVPAATYRAHRYQVEPDASSASYFFAAAALLGRTVEVPGLGRDALQGDLAFVRVLEQMGAEVRQTSTSTTVVGGRLQGVTVNMRDISDTMPTLAAIAPYAQGPTTIVDVANTRVKECDRLEACAGNLRRLGVEVDTGPDWIRIHPGTPNAGRVETFRDHRIAMAFSIAGLRTPGITLDDPTCVKKTFPTFHSVLAEVVQEIAREARLARNGEQFAAHLDTGSVGPE
ncbi:3-phosphoshikimate 1-carboxyvinyltransferase [Cellulomonas sp. URHD0024]|uniref:3-phosphoshikimate 1-carboxyvinyltransferase n=1 Tax=Cellulomonas sp. URHD0024 TaxID=1302620 RepID=UPI0004041AFD|nr:3-phosphoshikimate 1-carboxyvinyltransferase [Cellulomonas sp. URHD0024]